MRYAWTMRLRHTLVAVLGFATLILSPQLACSGDSAVDPAIARRMQAAIAGPWEYTDGATTIVFRLEQSGRAFDPDNPQAARSWIPSAHACGTHALIKQASACTDSYVMPLDVIVVQGESAGARARGVFTSYDAGDYGRLWIALGTTELTGSVEGRDTLRVYDAKGVERTLTRRAGPSR